MAISLLIAGASTAVAAPPKAHVWKFVVSGDSRNCGDVVMPMIAEGAKANEARFYWHLGDFRLGKPMDEDLAHDPLFKDLKMTPSKYKEVEWPDFVNSQLKPFAPVSVYLSIGNHELVDHDRDEYRSFFHDWLDSPGIREARAKEDLLEAPVQTYFHWTQGGVDFISLDNASTDQFDADQMRWFEKLIERDRTDPSIKTVVVGMHEALPDSISLGHSMSQAGNPVSIESGRKVYLELLKTRDQTHKGVYILASHSHFFMEGTFNTDYWKSHGGVLPGWIVGTAGATRYPLPPAAKDAVKAETHVYGYLVGSVDTKTGKIDFKFERLQKDSEPKTIIYRYGKELIDFCFDQNQAGHS